jgi:hypothetical protein
LKRNYPDYFADLDRYLKGENVSSDNKPYEAALGELRIFYLQSLILFKKVLTLVKEIEGNKNLATHHKDLLLDNFMSGLVSNYIVSCEYLDMVEMEEIRNKLYIGFMPLNMNQRDSLRFFKNNYFELRDYIKSKKYLLDYYNNNAH